MQCCYYHNLACLDIEYDISYRPPVCYYLTAANATYDLWSSMYKYGACLFFSFAPYLVYLFLETDSSSGILDDVLLMAVFQMAAKKFLYHHAL